MAGLAGGERAPASKDQPLRRNRGNARQRLSHSSGPSFRLHQLGSLIRNACSEVPGSAEGLTSTDHFRRAGGREREGLLPAWRFRPGPPGSFRRWLRCRRRERLLRSLQRCSRGLPGPARATLSAPRRRGLLPPVRPDPSGSLPGLALEVPSVAAAPLWPFRLFPGGPETDCGDYFASLQALTDRRSSNHPGLTVGGWSGDQGWH